MVNAIANLPEKDNSAKPFNRFKIADPQYVLSVDPAATIEEMENALWQQIGGHEIISLIRRDLIDGTNPNYTIISDLERLYREYNPKTIIPIENTSSYIFNSFGIPFAKYLPSADSLASLETSPANPVDIEQEQEGFSVFVYVADVPDTFEVEVQSIAAQEIFHDTIYEGGSSLS